MGRGTIVVLLAELSIAGAGWPVVPGLGALLGLTGVVLALARRMAGLGPRTRTTVPAAPTWPREPVARAQRTRPDG